MADPRYISDPRLTEEMAERAISALNHEAMHTHGQADCLTCETQDKLRAALSAPQEEGEGRRLLERLTEPDAVTAGAQAILRSNGATGDDPLSELKADQITALHADVRVAVEAAGRYALNQPDYGGHLREVVEEYRKLPASEQRVHARRDTAPASPQLSDEDRGRLRDAVMAELPDKDPWDGLGEGEVEEAIDTALRKLASHREPLWKPPAADETYIPAVVDRQGQPGKLASQSVEGEAAKDRVIEAARHWYASEHKSLPTYEVDDPARQLGEALAALDSSQPQQQPEEGKDGDRWPGVPGRWSYGVTYYGGNVDTVRAPGLTEAAELAGEKGRVIAIREYHVLEEQQHGEVEDGERS